MTAVESDRRKIEEAYLKAVDIGYSYHLAKKMEEFKSNPVLGYRTAGSKAEFDTGEFLKEEMKRIGLSDIHKDELCLDSWEFEKAVMRFTDRDGEKHEIQLGAYQTEFVTDGWKEYPLVYAGRGKEADYDDVDVTGCDGGYQPERRVVDQLSGVSGPLKGRGGGDRSSGQRLWRDRQ